MDLKTEARSETNDVTSSADRPAWMPSGGWPIRTLVGHPHQWAQTKRCEDEQHCRFKEELRYSYKPSLSLRRWAAPKVLLFPVTTHIVCGRSCSLPTARVWRCSSRTNSGCARPGAVPQGAQPSGADAMRESRSARPPPCPAQLMEQRECKVTPSQPEFGVNWLSSLWARSARKQKSGAPFVHC
eukprot:GHVU01121323.1.p1 GENE.GHVU01121323.1~~GHVU01121323.1.p1  ORF type:complete len:184 (+),score=1.95 GHVU01121323.1:519-1070(+)